MARPHREKVPGGFFHVLNRGADRRPIVVEDADRWWFLETIGDTIRMWGVVVHAYCLMKNHFHLLVETPQGNLARAMRHLSATYTQRFNRKWERDGPLFRGRYSSFLIESNDHLLEVGRYVHRNPVEAGIVEAPEDYAWSSHRGYLNPLEASPWLTRDLLLGLFGATPQSAVDAFRKFMAVDPPVEMTRRIRLAPRVGALGSPEFIARHRTGAAERDPVPWPKVLREVVDYFGLSPEDLWSRRREAQEAKEAAVLLGRLLAEATNSTMGESLGLAHNSISDNLKRARTRAERSLEFRCSLREIERRLE